MLSGSRVVRGVERRIAASASMPSARCRPRSPQVAQEFAALDDAYLAARADDIREVGDAADAQPDQDAICGDSSICPKAPSSSPRS